MIIAEPTTPLIFHAQPGGTFSFMGCFMYQYPKQTCVLETLFYTFVNKGKRGGFAYVSVKTCGESCSGTILPDGRVKK